MLENEFLEVPECKSTLFSRVEQAPFPQKLCPRPARHMKQKALSAWSQDGRGSENCCVTIA